MKECIFCFAPAKMSGEHVFSDWMNAALPQANTLGDWKGVFSRSGHEDRRYTMPDLDWRVNVVCEACNNGWMSDIENIHAKPVMSPLIAGEVGIPLDQDAARSIAIFAFKTAVIIDAMRKNGAGLFYSRRQRSAFKEHLFIPVMTSMWMCLYVPAKSRRADVLSGYYSGDLPFGGSSQLYVCTYGVGHFVFQVLSVKSVETGTALASEGFQDTSVPLWPNFPPEFVWPASRALRSVEDFGRYHRRWETPSSIEQRRTKIFNR